MRIRKYMYSVIYVMLIFLFMGTLTISASATSNGTVSGSDVINTSVNAVSSGDAINTNGGEVTKELIVVNDQVNGGSITLIDAAEGENTQYVNLVLNNRTDADSTIYISNDNRVRTIQWSMNAPITLEGYAFHTGNYLPDQRSPKEWKLYGTNDISGEWVLLDAVEDGKLEGVGANTLSSTFAIETPGEYQHYKIELINTIKEGAPQYKFRELFLYAEKSKSEEEEKTLEAVKGRVDNDSIVIFGGTEGENTVETLKTAFDMSTSSTCSVNVNSPAEEGNNIRTMQWSMREPVKLEAYSFYTSSSAMEIFPKTWKLYGTKDINGEWVLLDDVQDGKITP